MQENNIKKINPLLERARLPGESFTLPSQGLFYTHGELSDECKHGEVHMYPLTAYDEINLKSPDKLFSGKAITETIQRCVPLIKQPEKLLAKDVDFILTCLRKITFGPHVDVTYKHTCKNSKDHEYSVNIDEFIRQTKKIDPTLLSSQYSLEVSNGQKIELSPPRFDGVIQMYQNFSSDEDDIEKIKDSVIVTISGMINKVDDVDDPEMIREWLDTISAGWIEDIQDKIEEINDWGVAFESKVKCKDCGEEVSLATTLNPLAFFISR